MPTKRKPRVDSVQGQLAVYQAVSTHVEAPVPLNDAQLVIFKAIIQARAATSWSEHDLLLACKLAKMEAHWDMLFDQVTDEGPTQINERGTKTANPVHTAMMQTASTIQSLTRTLGISASQTGKTGQDAKAANEASDKAREALGKASNSFA